MAWKLNRAKKAAENSCQAFGSGCGVILVTIKVGSENPANSFRRDIRLELRQGMATVERWRNLAYDSQLMGDVKVLLNVANQATT